MTFTSRDNESWYCFHRVCLSVCVSTNQKVVLKICLVVWTVDHHVSGCEWQVFVCLFCRVSKMSLAR